MLSSKARKTNQLVCGERNVCLQKVYIFCVCKVVHRRVEAFPLHRIPLRLDRECLGLPIVNFQPVIVTAGEMLTGNNYYLTCQVKKCAPFRIYLLGCPNQCCHPSYGPKTLAFDHVDIVNLCHKCTNSYNQQKIIALGSV